MTNKADQPESRSGGDASRRDLIKLGTLTAGAAAATLCPATAEAATTGKKIGTTVIQYPRQKVASLKELRRKKYGEFNYPDSNSPCGIMDMGKKVTGGVGPRQSVVAYSMICSHQGCKLLFNKSAGSLECPCHFSKFDPKLKGQMVIGQATSPIPQVVLEMEGDNVYAIAMNGLIYGRAMNV